MQLPLDWMFLPLIRNDGGQSQREHSALEMSGMSGRDGAIPHFSAFRPLNGMATSSSSKFLDKPVTSEAYAQKDNGKSSPQQSSSEGNVSSNFSTKVHLWFTHLEFHFKCILNFSLGYYNQPESFL